MNRKKAAWGSVVMVLIFLLTGAGCGILIMNHLEKAAFANPGLHLLRLAALLLAMYLLMYLQIILHEGGHLLFGLLSGYRFSSFRAGSLMLQKTEEGLRLRRLHLSGTGGQCLMEPPALQNGTMPYALYNLGGVLMNLFTALLCFLLSGCWPDTTVGTLLKMTALIGVSFAFTNGLPLPLRDVDNDASNLLAMRRDSEAVRAFWKGLTCNVLSSRGVRLRDMDPELFTLPAAADRQNSIVSTVAVLAENRLMDEGRIEEADAAAQELLKGGARIAGLYRSLLQCDRIFCAALRGEDPAPMLTRDQRKYMKGMKRFPSVLRTEYALARRDGDEKRAGTLLREFEKAAAQYPNPADIDSERELMALADAQIAAKA